MRRSRRPRSTPSVEPSPLAARPRCSRRPTTASCSCGRVASPTSPVRRSPEIRHSLSSSPSRLARAKRERERATVVTLDLGYRARSGRPSEHPLEHASLRARRGSRGLERRHDLRPVERRRDRALSRCRSLEDRARCAPPPSPGDDSKRGRCAAGRASRHRRGMPRPLLLASGYKPPFRLLYGAATLPAPRTTSRACRRRRPGSRTHVRARSAPSVQTSSSSRPPTRARSSRETTTSSRSCWSWWRSSPPRGGLLALRRRTSAPRPSARSVPRFALRNRRPWPSPLPFAAGLSGLSGFFGFRSVGKILITVYVIARQPTIAGCSRQGRAVRERSKAA